MIRSLINITNLSVIDQNLEGNLVRLSRLQFDDNHIGKGGFGSVCQVLDIDGDQRQEFLVKLIYDEQHTQQTYEAISLLHEKLKVRQKRTGIPVYHEVPELVGLPFMAFKAYDPIEQKHCVALLMFDLKALGYLDYGSDDQGPEMDVLTIPDRLYLGHQLARVVSVLHDLDFLHCDLGESSIFINMDRCQLAVIDFDGGFHFDKQEKGLTIGKIGHLISDRFRDLLGRKTTSNELTIQDRIAEEYWVLGNLVFELVLGVMPFFFLPDAESKTRRDYLTNFTWPYIDYHSADFNASSFELHKSVIDILSALEDNGGQDLVSAFRRLFNKGYANERKRLSGREWSSILNDLNNAVANQPVVIGLESDKKEIHKYEEEVAFSWSSSKYDRLYLNNKLVPLHTSRSTLKLTSDQPISLRAINAFAEIEESIIVAAVKKDPVITDFKVSTELRDSLEPVLLSWATENTDYVMLSNSSELHPPKGTVEVSPSIDTNYSMKAYGFFGQMSSQSLFLPVAKPEIESFAFDINLNHGIDNIDLRWKTKNTSGITISPMVGNVESEGLAHVKIQKETEFTIEAIGLFSTTKTMVTASPFPVPIIKSLFVNTPNIEIRSSISIPELDSRLVDSSLEINSSCALQIPEFKSLNNNLNLHQPGFTHLNPGIEHRRKSEESVFSKAYKFINQRLSKGLQNE